MPIKTIITVVWNNKIYGEVNGKTILKDIEKVYVPITYYMNKEKAIHQFLFTEDHTIGKIESIEEIEYPSFFNRIINFLKNAKRK